MLCRPFILGVAVGLLLSATASASEIEPVFVIDFTDHSGEDIADWLENKGFVAKQDMEEPEHVELSAGDEGLVLTTKKHSFGLLANEKIKLPDFGRIEIDWGVKKHPEGASYEAGTRNEALMLYVFMGDELMPSGSFFLPDSPYFVALYLCTDEDRVEHPYVGAGFKESGRYVCLDQPREGALVTSRFDLLDAYQEYFGKPPNDVPGISGLGLGLETKEAGDGGTAAGFIRQIRFYSDTGCPPAEQPITC